MDTLEYLWSQCSFLSESISKQQLAEVEKFADKLFAKIGVDVELSGKHFFDRLNDTRNKKDISTAELVSLFRKTFKMHKKPISNMDAGIQAVIKDVNADINLPFMIKWDSKNSEFDLVAKTIMRKKNFQTSNDILTV
jgi:hypothetical protein